MPQGFPSILSFFTFAASRLPFSLFSPYTVNKARQFVLSLTAGVLQILRQLPLLFLSSIRCRPPFDSVVSSWFRPLFRRAGVSRLRCLPCLLVYKVPGMARVSGLTHKLIDCKIIPRLYGLPAAALSFSLLPIFTST